MKYIHLFSTLGNLATINCCQNDPITYVQLKLAKIQKWQQIIEISNTEMTLQERLRKFIKNNFRFLTICFGVSFALVKHGGILC